MIPGTITKSLQPSFPCPTSNLPAVLSARRMCALVLLTTCLGGAWTVEQPGGSLMEFFPTWRFVMQNLFRVGGPEAVRSSVFHSFPSAQTSEPTAVCEVSCCTLYYWSACVISSSVVSCSAMLQILANYIGTLVFIHILVPNKFRIGWAHGARGVDRKVVDATLQSAHGKTPLWLF